MQGNLWELWDSGSIACLPGGLCIVVKQGGAIFGKPYYRVRFGAVDASHLYLTLEEAETAGIVLARRVLKQCLEVLDEEDALAVAAASA